MPLKPYIYVDIQFGLVSTFYCTVINSGEVIFQEQNMQYMILLEKI